MSVNRPLISYCDTDIVLSTPSLSEEINEEIRYIFESLHGINRELTLSSTLKLLYGYCKGGQCGLDGLRERYSDISSLFEDSVAKSCRSHGLLTLARASVYYLSKFAESAACMGYYTFICCIMNSLLKVSLTGKMAMSAIDKKQLLEVVVETCSWAYSGHNCFATAVRGELWLSHLCSSVVAFDAVVMMEAPLSLPVSTSLVDSLYLCSQSLTDRAQVSTLCVEGFDFGGDERFVSFLFRSKHLSDKAVFSAWCIYRRVCNMIRNADPALQYLCHYMSMRLVGIAATEDALRMILCHAVCSVCHRANVDPLAKIYNAIKDGPPHDNSIDDALIYLKVVDQLLSVSLMFLSTVSLRLVSPFLWLLYGLNEASDSIAETNLRYCFQAIIFITMLKYRSSAETNREAMVWLVDFCRKDLSGAFEMYTFCLYLYNKLTFPSSHDTVCGCLRYLGVHLSKIRLTREAQRTAETSLLSRFDKAYSSLSAHGQKTAMSLGLAPAVSTITQSVLATYSRSSQINNKSSYEPCRNSEEWLLIERLVYDYLTVKRVDGDSGTEAMTGIINGVVAGQWLTLSEANIGVSEGLQLSAIHMILQDDTAPKLFIYNNFGSKILRKCLQDWSSGCLSDFNGCHFIAREALKHAYETVVSSLWREEADDDGEDKFKLTKIQIDTNMSIWNERSKSDSFLPSVPNLINRTVMAIYLTSQNLSVCAATGVINVDSESIGMMLKHHCGVLIPIVLSYVLQWSLRTFLSSCCNVSDEEMRCCETSLKYCFTCIELCKLLPSDEARLELVVHALTDRTSSVDILDTLLSLVAQDWQIENNEMIILVLGGICELYNALVPIFVTKDTVDRNSTSTNLNLKACFLLVQLGGVASIIQCRIRFRPLGSQSTPNNLDVLKLTSAVDFLFENTTKQIQGVNVHFGSGPQLFLLRKKEGGVDFDGACITMHQDDTVAVYTIDSIEVDADTIAASLRRAVGYPGPTKPAFMLSQCFDQGVIVLPSFQSLFMSIIKRNDLNIINSLTGKAFSAGSLSKIKLMEDDLYSQGSIKSTISASTLGTSVSVAPFLRFLCHTIFLPLRFRSEKQQMVIQLTERYFLSDSEHLRTTILNLIVSSCSLPISHQRTVSYHHWLPMAALRYLGVLEEVWDDVAASNRGQENIVSIVGDRDATLLLEHHSNCFQHAEQNRLNRIFALLQQLPDPILCGDAILDNSSWSGSDRCTFYRQCLVIMRFYQMLLTRCGEQFKKIYLKRVMSLLLCGFISRLLSSNALVWRIYIDVLYDLKQSCVASQAVFSEQELSILKHIFSILSGLLKPVSKYLETDYHYIAGMEVSLGWHARTIDFIHESTKTTTPMGFVAEFSPTHFSAPKSVLRSAEHPLTNTTPRAEEKAAFPFRGVDMHSPSKKLRVSYDGLPRRQLLIQAPSSTVYSRDPIITSPNGSIQPISPPVSSKAATSGGSINDNSDLSPVIIGNIISSESPDPRTPVAGENESFSNLAAVQKSFDIAAINKKFRRPVRK